ncbi:MAG: hypothetical protein A2X12_02275 [Bacteroidetes bacterium GWE2_29_8]|nr:MAG: hypothetical protein A2X12_02275 [Bacteroidetes bacterium GWE2_29_8]
MKRLLFIIIYLCSTALVFSFNINDHIIIPYPKVFLIQKGEVILNNSTVIVLKNVSKEENELAIENLKSTLKRTFDIAPEIYYEVSKPYVGNKFQIIIEMIDSTQMKTSTYKNINNEGYYLDINKNEIKIKVSTPRALFYAVSSLNQLIEKSTDKKLPLCNIVDWPDMPMRGISDDISRGQVSTLENFKKIIDNLAKHKMNVYMLYLEDMIRFEKYPSIGKGRGALSKYEIKEIVAYAAKYHIEVIPIFQTLGHYENILSLPEFYKYADHPGAASLNLANDSIYVFLEDLLNEIFPLFPSEYFHMGADESYDVGLGKSKDLLANSDIATIHANHYKRIYDICKKNNKKVMMYSDIVLEYPKIISMLPKDIIMIDWHYSIKDYNKSTKTFKDAELEYYVSPTVWNFYTTFPTNTIALPNIKNFIYEGLQNGTTGMVNSTWGDFGAETFRELNYFGYAWSAQCAWNIKDADINTFTDDFFYDFFGIRDTRLKRIYQDLSMPYNQIIWHDVWRHPLLPVRKASNWFDNSKPEQKILWYEWTMPQTMNDLCELEGKVTKNKDHIELLKFLINLNNWYKVKLQTQLLIQDKFEKEKNIDNNDIVNKIEDNITLLTSLKENYTKLWLKYNKMDNLNMVIDKFDRLIQYFFETELNVMINVNESPEISSKWICQKKNDNTFADSAVFYKEFVIDSLPDSAYCQVIADSYSKIYVNDSLIDSLFVKRTLSLYTEYKRIKYIDLMPYLKMGNNKVEIFCQNFGKNAVASFNLLSEIYVKNQKLVINSDKTWLVKTNDKKETNAFEKEYKYTVIAPNFKFKRLSWIER